MENVETTLKALRQIWVRMDGDFSPSLKAEVHAHLEALVKGQTEGYDAALAQERARRKRLEAALLAIIERWEAAKSRHEVTEADDPEYIAIARAALAGPQPESTTPGR